MLEKKTTQRIVAVVLMAVLLLSLLPTTAFVTHAATSQRDAIINIAIGEIGYHEKASNDGLDSKTDNIGSNNYTKYGRWFNMNPAPWCAIFVSWCAYQAGIPESAFPHFASCTYGGRAWFQSHGRWRDASYTPQKGDLVFFDWDNCGECEHVGLVEYVAADGIHTIEGNTSNDVVERRVRKAYIAGYGVPDYGDGVNPVTPVDGPVLENYNYPERLAVGESFSLYGTIRSCAPLEYASVWVEDAQGNTVLSWRNSGEMDICDIHTSADNAITFGSLPAGQYHYCVEATDTNHTYRMLLDKFFTVGREYANAGDDFYAYMIKSDTWKHIEAAPISGSRDANVQLAANGNDVNDPKQIWHFQRQSDGSYKITNEYDQYVLDVLESGTENGANVIGFSEDHGGPNQRWYLMYGDNGTNIVPKHAQDKALDVTNGSDDPGTNIELWKMNGSAAQGFSVYPVEGGYVKPARPAASKVTDVIPDSTAETCKLQWSASNTVGTYDARVYDLRIWQGTDTSKAPNYEKGGITGTSENVALPAGDYTVQVTAVNTKYYEWYTVGESTKITVPAYTVPVTLSRIEIASMPSKTTYRVGESLDTTGLTLKATYSDNSTRTISNGFTVSGFSSETAGTKTVTVTYEGKTVSFTVKVENPPVPADAPQIVVASKTTASGKDIVVELTAKNMPKVKSLMVTDFQFDSSMLELVNAELNLPSAFIAEWDSTNKIATFAFTENTNINGVIMTLTFHVKEGADGEFPITCEVYANQSQESGNETAVTMAVVPGTITVLSYERGDVNGDGYVNSDDSIYLLRYTLVPSRYPLNQSGDMNGDGYVNSDDAIYLLRHTLLPTRYPLY